jgi:hypothetical protein
MKCAGPWASGEKPKGEGALDVACCGMRKRSSLARVWWIVRRPLVDVPRFLSLGFRSRIQMSVENLFLRKQLALYH